MNYPDLSKWQLMTAVATFIFLVVFFAGRYFVASELIDANHQVTSLQQELKQTHELLLDKQARIAVVERETDILRRTTSLLRESERERQDEIAELKSDLAFYQRLGGASGSQAALAVHFLELQTTQSTRVYRLVFTLTQNLRWAAVIAGQVHLGMDGIQDGVAVHLTEDQLIAASSRAIDFRFKYFQQIERLITLPEGFEPVRLTIRLQSRSLRAAVEHSMDWQDMFDRSGLGLPAEQPPQLPDD